MPTRIDRRFADLARQNRAALVTFVMAGDPDLATCLDILKALPRAGADVIELGMPFTDPMADGPAIQAAGLRALAAGTTLAKTLALAADFRQSRPAISKHLRVLRDARLVVEEKSGRERLYQLQPRPLQQVAGWIEGYRAFWQVSLTNLKRYLEDK